MIRFEKNEGDESVSVEIHEDSTIDEAIEAFERFLRGCGYVMGNDQRIVFDDAASDMKEKLDEIDKRLKLVEETLNATKQPPTWLPPDYRHAVTCPQCGMNWSGVMGFVCSAYECPLQMRVIC